jgi:hypothetical protein
LPQKDLTPPADTPVGPPLPPAQDFSPPNPVRQALPPAQNFCPPPAAVISPEADRPTPCLPGACC